VLQPAMHFGGGGGGGSTGMSGGKFGSSSNIDFDMQS